MQTPQEKPARLRARFHFDRRLDHFLAREHRDCEFDWDCPPQSNLKHMVEALGVPHTEVGMVLVNGHPAPLNQPLRAGDSIQVLPALPCAGEQALRFAADSHLGGLARLLRMAGFDTLFDNAWPDQDLAGCSRQDGRIVLSRDRDLLKRSDILHGCHVQALHPPEQLRELALRYPLAANMKPFSLCLLCNVELVEEAAEVVAPRLPPSVKSRLTRFCACPACRRVYWEGSHWTRMRGMLEQLLPQPAVPSPRADAGA